MATPIVSVMRHLQVVQSEPVDQHYPAAIHGATVDLLEQSSYRLRN